MVKNTKPQDIVIGGDQDDEDQGDELAVPAEEGKPWEASNGDVVALGEGQYGIVVAHTEDGLHVVELGPGRLHQLPVEALPK